MKPFRTSFTARMVSIALGISLVGGGLIAALHLDPTYLVPLVLLGGIGFSLIGLAFGIYEHTGPVVGLLVALPVLLWPYVMLLEVIVREAPTWGWALVIVGAVPLILTGVASATVRAPRVAEGAPSSTVSARP